jgi:uncharacterized membrane protein
MNTLMKLAAVALSAAGIAGGVAVAQTTTTANDQAGRSQTANDVGTNSAPAAGTSSAATSPDMSANTADTSMQPRTDRN